MKIEDPGATFPKPPARPTSASPPEPRVTQFARFITRPSVVKAMFLSVAIGGTVGSLLATAIALVWGL